MATQLMCEWVTVKKLICGFNTKMMSEEKIILCLIKAHTFFAFMISIIQTDYMVGGWCYIMCLCFLLYRSHSVLYVEKNGMSLNFAIA